MHARSSGWREAPLRHGLALGVRAAMRCHWLHFRVPPAGQEVLGPFRRAGADDVEAVGLNGTAVPCAAADPGRLPPLDPGGHVYTAETAAKETASEVITVSVAVTAMAASAEAVTITPTVSGRTGRG